MQVTCYVSCSEIELWSVSVEERCVASAFLFLQYVYLALELCMWVDRTRLCQYLSSFDLCSLYASQQCSDVVTCLCLVEGLSEHLYACYYDCSLLVCKSYDLYGVTSLQHSSSVSSRSPRGLRLFEAADLVLDNCGIPGDASVEFSDGRRVGPTSTAVGAALLQAVVCRVKEKAMEEGVDAEFFVSSNVDGGDAVNDLLVEKYGGEIPGLK